MNEANDQNEVVLANLPAGPTERRIALAVSLVLLGIGVAVVPFGRVRLPAANAWVPLTTSLMIAADLFTWLLLISQFKIVRSRALLVLANGYLFAAAINIPILLTFPGAFSPAGLLNAGLHSTFWLSLSRFAGYSIAVIFYAAMKKEPRTPKLQGSSGTAVAASAAIVISAVLAWTWITTSGESHLPNILLAPGQPSAGFKYVATLISLLTATSLLLLWFQRRTVLNLWLMVATSAWLGQQIAKFIHFSGSFTFSFYASTALLFISSVVLLVVLLRETMTLYGRLAVSLVTVRRLSAEKLLRSEAYLSEAQRLSHTGSFGRSPLSGEIHWSDETYRIFELDRSTEPTLESVIERIHPEDRDQVRETIDRATDERTGFDIEYRFLRQDDSVKYLHVVAQAFEHASGELEFVGAVTDITERKQSEERLRQAHADLAHANRVTTMGELAASLAHEVKQPIAAAVTNASACLRWLQRDEPDLSEACAAATRILRDGKLAGEIIGRIRAQFEKGDLKRELVDVNEIIREMIVLLRGEATRYNISIQVELAGDLPQIIGDRVQLQQVTMNLIVNSIDAMKDVDGKRDIAIKSRRTENDQLLVSVSDTGIGIPPQQADQIFNAFFTTKPHGTGMGLSISRSIIESHGGRLWAADNSPRGATFQFTLPASGAANRNGRLH